MKKTEIKQINDFIDKSRAKCLWYLNRNYYPNDLESFLNILNKIKNHSTVNEYKQACKFEQWLLQNFNEKSAI